MTLATAKPRLLCVDDEPELLDSIRLVLRKRYDVTTAQSGPEALALFEDDDQPRFDAVVSDMRMPEMNGAQFLTTLRERYPEVPRLLLSGQSDLEAAIAAINDAKIFRFLTKPCPPELLMESIDEAVQQARLRNIEKDLLDRTLNGTVELLTDVIRLVNPDAIGRADRIRGYVHRMCHSMERPIAWDLDLATMLCQLGCVAMPEASDEDDDVAERRTELTAELLIRVPRLESTAALIRSQLAAEPIRDDGNPDHWSDRELNAEILRIAVRFDDLIRQGESLDEAFAHFVRGDIPTANFLLDALGLLRAEHLDVAELELTVRQLQPGMILQQDLHLTTGPLLAPTGMELTAALIGRIHSFARSSGVQEPVLVQVDGQVARQLQSS